MQQELPGFEEPNTSAKKATATQASTKKTAANESAAEQTSITSFLGDLDASKDAQLILTPNQPLAQQLRRLRLESLQKKVAPAAPIQVLSAWLGESVSERAELPIASDQQLRVLMQQALAKSQSKHPDLNVNILAPSALSAWRDLKRFDVERENLRTAETGQEAYFSDTIDVFEQFVQTHGLTTLELEIQKQIQQEAPDNKTAHSLCLYAFSNPLPPLVERWIDHCFKLIHTADFLGETGECYLYSAANEQEELSDAARWANGILAQNSQARVGIVYRSLGENLTRARRIIESNLNTSKSDDSRHIRLSCSLRPPPSKVGSIRSALGLLQLNRYTLSHAEARFVIHTPFWGGEHGGDNDANNTAVRSDWDTALCSTQLRHIKPPQLRELLQPEQSDNHKVLNECLLAFADLRRRVPNVQSPESWAIVFCQQLQALGWPKSTQSMEADSQLWLDLLGKFASCGTVAPEISVSEALNLLAQCCDERRTDPSAAHSGVRLLDTAEGAADFSHLWVVGVDRSRWPSPPSPNPLLPLRLQREHCMPGATRGQETVLAEQLLSRLAESAAEVVFSYTEQEDGVALAPSALLPKNLHPLELPMQEKTQPENTQVFEYIDTQTAPALSSDETQVRGGAALLSTLAQSPFHAFAQWRLLAKPLPEPKIGLDAADRGTLLHRVLEAIWRKLENQAALIATTDVDLKQLCQDAAQSELRNWQQRSYALSPALVNLEIKRLTELAKRWLALEATRTPFEVVNIEESLSANIGSLTLSLRLDRMDRMADGSLVLIDYKTGRTLSTKRWTELPPAEPQLPLYAISLAETPEAICFAQVRPDSLKIVGLGSSKLDTGVSAREDWGTLQDQWREALTELADTYAQGDTTLYETPPIFGRGDPLAPLHRFNEYEALVSQAPQDKKAPRATQAMQDTEDTKTTQEREADK